MRQQVGNAEDRVVIFLTNADIHSRTVGTADHTMERQRNGRPLILAHTAIVVGAEIGIVAALIQRHRTQVQAGSINMGNVEMEALCQASAADGCGQDTLFAIDEINLVPCFQCLPCHKGTVTGLLQQFLTVRTSFALRLALVQKGLIALAESICLRQHLRRLICHRLIFVEKAFQCFLVHVIYPFLSYLKAGQKSAPPQYPHQSA